MFVENELVEFFRKNFIAREQAERYISRALNRVFPKPAEPPEQMPAREEFDNSHIIRGLDDIIGD